MKGRRAFGQWAAAGVFAAAFGGSMSGGAPPAAAEPEGQVRCHYPACTPGIMPNVVLGAPCEHTTYYVFGVNDWGRLMFCGSARRYDPRWFRSPVMHGIKQENADCSGYQGEVAQAPDGLFLTCVGIEGESYWLRGDAVARSPNWE